jgi:hypothetical protein
VKWPRYHIQLPTGLEWKQANSACTKLLRTTERQVLTISQFKYDPATGVADTRLRRESC